ncbi:hypothetical protein [Sphingosinicella sp. BN140058]|uniref:hypothetical protein n=1 Tax=Sphingosinicella sp. BN140058 TaxID=1892855 RepID=UPI001011DFA6|nr:hypothetical protein [Sphingosinicella sp. BN140058]QAY77899.1 hypothetical protein ETR14_16260 [Sphingosinicella sp. BN140058]
MLRTPAPFPQVGSYALTIHQDEITLARIQGRNGEDATISLPLFSGASGNRTVPLGELIDATPLSDDEASEWSALNQFDFGTSPPRAGTAKRVHWDRYRALTERDIQSPVLERLLDLAAGQTERRAA